MAQKDADTLISNNERNFILQALAEDRRVDGRTPFEYRNIKFQFAPDDSGATVALGATRVMAVVTAVLEAPFPDRPNEGSIRFNVEFSPMASPSFQPGRPGEAAIEVGRLVERGLRESAAVDQEALCVLAGRKVWAVRVDVLVLDHGGNLVDACSLAALAALLAFRRPDVSIGGADGQQVTVHTSGEKETVPLSIHHLPLAVTFALFGDGDTMVVDPSLKEEAARGGLLTVIMNTHQEVCAVQKADGIGLSVLQLMRCMRIAATQVEALTVTLRAALKAHELARLAARVRRHDPATSSQAPDTGGGFPGAAAMEGLETMEDAALLGSSSDSDEDEERDAEGGMAASSDGEEEQGVPHSSATTGTPSVSADPADAVRISKLSVTPGGEAGKSEPVSQQVVGGKRSSKGKRSSLADDKAAVIEGFASLAAAIGGGPSGGDVDLSTAVKRTSSKKAKRRA